MEAIPEFEEMFSSYSVREEIVNAITHGIGLLFAAVALTLMLVQTIRYGSALDVATVSVYGGSMVLMFLASTLYHSIPFPKAKPWLKLFDHGAIYLLIAGSYTPFILFALPNQLAFLIFIWSCALVGLVYKVVFLGKHKWVSVSLYLAMGWACAFLIPDLAKAIDPVGLTMLKIGGLCYTVGVLFYVAKKMPYHHGIWHVFVIGGAVCQWVAIYVYLVPNTPDFPFLR